MAVDKVVYASVPKTDVSDKHQSTHQAPKGFGARHTQALVLFLCLTVGFAIRAQLSVSMVAMTSHTFDCDITSVKGNNTEIIATGHMTQEENVTEDTKRKKELSRNLSKWNVYRTYDWNKSKQDIIMFAFFIGYTTMMLPMGCIAQKFGGKKPIMVALAINGVLSILTPWLPIFGGWIAICVCRFLQGTTQAALYPGIHTILGQWAPLSERGRLSTYVYNGAQFGTIIIFLIAGVFAGSPSLGWPVTFWFCGILGLICFVMLWKLGAATPHDHPSISLDELTFIAEGGGAELVPKKRRVPWKSLLTSTAVWGLIATQAGSTTGFNLVLTQTPTYMNFVLGVELKKNGLFSSLPYVAMYISAMFFGFLADYATNKKFLSIANIRRIANTIGLPVSGLCMITFSYMTSTIPAVTMLIITMALHSAILVGFHVNHIDLAPNFAGSIMGFGNMIANLTSLTVPVIVSNVVRDDVRNQSRWQIVFLIFMGLQMVTNLIFLIFVKGTVQPWNFYGEEDDSKDVEKMMKVKEQSEVRNKNSKKM